MYLDVYACVHASVYECMHACIKHMYAYIQHTFWIPLLAVALCSCLCIYVCLHVCMHGSKCKLVPGYTAVRRSLVLILQRVCIHVCTYECIKHTWMCSYFSVYVFMYVCMNASNIPGCCAARRGLVRMFVIHTIHIRTDDGERAPAWISCCSKWTCAHTCVSMYSYTYMRMYVNTNILHVHIHR